MELCDKVRSGRVIQAGATTPVGWGSDTNATGARPLSGGSCGGGGEGASAGAVAQGVVDVFDQFPGGGDVADVAAAACGDAVAVAADAGVFADALHGLDGGPAD